jgi:hypothetical protein
MTIEPPYAHAEALTGTTLSKEQVEWVDAFYRNVRERMLNFYEGARLEASIIHDRELVAKHWQDKLDFFSGNLTRNRRMESNLEALHAPIPAALYEVLDTLSDMAACKNSYEMHA